MGQEQSFEPRQITPEQASRELALKFASKCYTELELFHFKEVFRSLADTESGVRYWTEGTLCRFLQIPDALGAGPVLNQMSMYLGAFPFASQAPAILTMEAVIKVLTLLTDRYTRILKRGDKDRLRLLYSSLAVYDRRASEVHHDEPAAIRELLRQDAPVDDADQATESPSDVRKAAPGFDIDQPLEEDPDDQDDPLALAALDSLDEAGIIGLGDRPNVHHTTIPTDNLLKLIELLLYVAPLHPQENLSKYGMEITDDSIESFRKTANSIVRAFGIDTLPGIQYPVFKTVIPTSMPYMFRGLSPLFEHFLFDKHFDLSKRRRQSSGSSGEVRSTTSRRNTTNIPPEARADEEEAPLVPEGGEILNAAVLSQLSFFIEPSTLFRRLHHLYSGSTHGFSMGSFESAVFSWQAPTLLLVSGTLLAAEPANSRERSFADALPPRRFPDSASMPAKQHAHGEPNHLQPALGSTEHREAPAAAAGSQVVYGAYIPVPFKHTIKQTFGNASALLFQLHPMHDVFHASEVSRDYVSFVTASGMAPHAGINIGSPLPGISSPSALSAGAPSVPLGPVSLYLDDALEFGVFTHTASGGGSFHPSTSPARTPGDRAESVPTPRRARSASESMNPSSAGLRTSAMLFSADEAIAESPLENAEASVASNSTKTQAEPTTTHAEPSHTQTAPPPPQQRPSYSHRRASSRLSISLPSAGPGDFQDRFSIESVEVWGLGGAAETEKKRREERAGEDKRRLRRESLVGRRASGGDEMDLLRLAGLLRGESGSGGSV